MKDYQDAQTTHEKEMKKKIHQMKIINPQATDEEFDTLLKSAGNASNVIKEVILTGNTGSGCNCECLLQCREQISGSFSRLGIVDHGTESNVSRSLESGDGPGKPVRLH
jgi:hypothetical protein